MSTEKQSVYVINNPAFSKKRLNYEIPDYRQIIDRTITIITNENGVVEFDDAGETRRLSGEDISSYLRGCLDNDRKFICFDAVDVHGKLLEIAATSTNFQQAVWALSATYSLWGLGILEQGIIWSTQSRAVSLPNPGEMIGKYDIPVANQHEWLRELLRRQFQTLLDKLPYLRNDYVGRRILREYEFDTPYIDPTERIVTRRQVHFKERLWPFLGLIEGWKKYGPAAVGIDVQGAIVADHLSRTQSPIGADPRVYLERQGNIASSIREEKKLASCYPESRPSTDPDTGEPRYKDNAGKKIKELWWTETAPSGSDSETQEARQYRLYPLDPSSQDADQSADYRHPLVFFNFSQNFRKKVPDIR